jgi:hypothetical protein
MQNDTELVYSSENVRVLYHPESDRSVIMESIGGRHLVTLVYRPNFPRKEKSERYTVELSDEPLNDCTRLAKEAVQIPGIQGNEALKTHVETMIRCLCDRQSGLKLRAEFERITPEQAQGYKAGDSLVTGIRNVLKLLRRRGERIDVDDNTISLLAQACDQVDMGERIVDYSLVIKMGLGFPAQ